MDLPLLSYRKSWKVLLGQGSRGLEFTDWQKELTRSKRKTSNRPSRRSANTISLLAMFKDGGCPVEGEARCLLKDSPSGSQGINGRWNLPNEHTVSQSIALKGWQCGRPNSSNEELISYCQVKSSQPCPFLSLLSYIKPESFQLSLTSSLSADIG